jgi:hypothetical protein
VSPILITIAKWTTVLFGLFLIAAGLVMLFAPQRAHATIRKAGSTNLINYSEITIRMIPAAALILSSGLSRFPLAFQLVGWFMLATSLVLYLVPRRLHHNFALACAGMLKPTYIRLAAPFSLVFGCLVIYAVM